MDYIKLLRPKHYIKNVIILLPMFFGGMLFDKSRWILALLGFVAFCFVSSAIYIINDYRDIEKDRMHPTKKNRPLASGRVNPTVALVIAAALIVATAAILVYAKSLGAALLLGLYFVLNVAYSFGLKDVPIVDIVILASGFVIRLLFGGVVTNVNLSEWILLVVMTGSLYMGLGKRRNELKSQSNTRKVLKYYNLEFLDKNMYVCVALTIAFYALWSIDVENPYMIWTVPVFIILLMRYSLNVEGDSDGDPVEVILHDKFLILLAAVYAVMIFALFYAV